MDNIQIKVFFYPHPYLRDRQLDTIRRWPVSNICNPEIAVNRVGAQVPKSKAVQVKIKRPWKQILPLLNIKFRPKSAPLSSVVYVWGGLIASGAFIIDIDNPWSLVGYNLRAMSLYRWIIKNILLSKRCKEIRCMSESCRLSLKELFGEQVYLKASVHYPKISQVVHELPEISNECRFLFVGTQFELKGGEALLKAFSRVYQRLGTGHLDIITHLPEKFESLAKSCPGIHIHPAQFTREQIHQEFMTKADVLIHPTYVDSFGMVILEALSYGLAVIATDIYAIHEMVWPNENGTLLTPPISIWNGVMPSKYYYHLSSINQHIQNSDTKLFESQLEAAIEKFIVDETWRISARKNSIKIIKERFAC
ncbi:MAG: glycosyltransferase [Pseudomonadota bacterium]